MKTAPVTASELQGVFAVPPLARRDDGSFDAGQNELIVRHIIGGGITRFLYGGNAFLYHMSLVEYERLLEWLAGFAGDLWVIPGAGPAYGRAIDQAPLIKRHRFPCVMMLPCNDPRDAAGLERGYREIANAAGAGIIVYLKEENALGPDKEAGLDMVARLVDAGICVGIKYAIVRRDPAEDAYLAALLERVDRRLVVSGIGERPAVVHMREFNLPGFTTGSGCLAPRLSQAMFEACRRGDFAAAEELRSRFLGLEGLRDDWDPAKVLHAATRLADIAATGPVPPYLSPLSATQEVILASVARGLAGRESAAPGGTAV